MCVGEVGDLKGPDVKLENLFYVEDCAEILSYEVSKIRHSFQATPEYAAILVPFD